MDDIEDEAFVNCDVCNIPFTGIEPFRQHLNGKNHKKRLNQKGLSKGKDSLIDPENGIYHCNFCGVTLPDMTVYNEHLLTAEHQAKVHERQEKHKENPSELKCELCGKTFNNVISLQQHLRSQPHEKALKKAKIAARLSDGVEEPLDSEDVSSGDILGSIVPKEYGSCNICLKHFGGPESYEQHMKSNVHKKKVLQQKLENELKEKETSVSEESNASFTKEIQDPEKSEYICLDCDKKFSGAVPFAQHINSNVHRKKVNQKKLLEKLAQPAMSELENEQILAEDVLAAARGNPLRNPLLTCDYCKVSCSGPENFKAHLDSKKHKNTVRFACYIEQQRKKSKDHEKNTNDGEMQPVVSSDDVNITDASNKESIEEPPATERNETNLPKFDDHWSVVDENTHMYGPKVLNFDPNSDGSLNSVDKKVHIDSINIPSNPDVLEAESAVPPSAPISDENTDNHELPSYESIAAESKLVDDESKRLYPQLDDLLDQPKENDEPPLAPEDEKDSSLSSGEEESESANNDRKERKKKTRKCKGIGMGKFVASVVSLLD